MEPLGKRHATDAQASRRHVAQGPRGQGLGQAQTLPCVLPRPVGLANLTQPDRQRVRVLRGSAVILIEPLFLVLAAQLGDQRSVSRHAVHQYINRSARVWYSNSSSGPNHRSTSYFASSTLPDA